MKDAKAAAVLSGMTPEKARDVTSALAQMRTGRAAASNAVQSVGG
jgi:flagellar motility protein MotE (MotC chaperone)